MSGFSQSALRRRAQGSAAPLVIGLVNNTSDRALRAIERQFLGLLQAASPDTDFRLRLFTCPEITRRTTPFGSTGEVYSDIAKLFDTSLDALIVTGMEPQARLLQNEPVYAQLARLADWAEEHAIPVIWSCLAAHAVVFHLDGISRIQLAEKCSGVFECNLAAPRNKLMNGLPSRWSGPHSRYHGLPEEQLTRSGYQMLSRSDEAGIDIFLRERAAPFLFLQGHPEYGSDSLVQEYRRDVGRYVNGERDVYPAVPMNVFDAQTSAKLARISEHGRRANLDELGRVVDCASPPCPWRRPAARLMKNWMSCMVRDGVRLGRRIQAFEHRVGPFR